MHDVAAHLADMEAVPLAEKRIELAAIALELGAFIEDLAESVLHHGDVLADADFAAKLLLQIGRGGEVIGMNMSFQNPLHIQPFGLAMCDDLIGAVGCCPAGGLIEIQNAVDNGGGFPRGVARNVRDSVCRGVEKGRDLGMHRFFPG